MPDVLKGEFKKLKDEIFDYKEQDDNQDFIKLLQIKDVSDDLKETLILLHSNYTTEIRETRNHYCRLFNKIVDRDIELLELVVKMLENNLNKNDNSSEHGIIGKIGGAGGIGHYLTHLPRIWMFMILVIVGMSVLHHFIPESFERSVKLFKNVFSFGLIGNSNNSTQPPNYYYPPGYNQHNPPNYYHPGSEINKLLNQSKNNINTHKDENDLNVNLVHTEVKK